MRLFNNILYVVESSVAQEAPLAHAVSVAEQNQARLTVVDVAPSISNRAVLFPGRPEVKNPRQAVLAHRRSVLESLVEPYAGRLEIRVDVLEGRMSLEAIRAVLRNEYDLLMKPAENPIYTKRLFGSDDMQLLRNCPCPVWLTRAADQSAYKTVLAAVDFDLDAPHQAERSLNDHIADVAGSLALSDFSSLHFVHAWDAPAETLVRTWSSDPGEAAVAYIDGMRSLHEHAFGDFQDQLRARVGEETYNHLGPRFHLRRGVAATTISETAEELQADVLVMGTVARTGIAGWLIGNTSEAVLEQVQCSVLAVKPLGFVSPVRLQE